MNPNPPLSPVPGRVSEPGGGGESAGDAASADSAGRAGAQIGAYYLNAHMYTVVPSQVRSDMAWLADKGTDFVCCGVLEQDVWAARENLALIIEEAARAGLRVLAVPSRWGGLTAGAPKVPSMFSVLNPHTWILDEKGRSDVAGDTSGVISSVHWPETLQFFRDYLTTLYRQHPALAGLIIDEPKAFIPDHSLKAKEALGAAAPRQAHLEAAARFYDDVCAFSKTIRPDLMTLLFMQAHYPEDQREVCARMPHLDYFGVDGRPWDLEVDGAWKAAGGAQESGKGKVLLSGIGQKFVQAARQNAKKSFFLIENHNLAANMVEPMDRHLPEVLKSGADLYLYYYYPRNVQQPERAMEVVGRHIKAYTQRRASKRDH